MKNLTDEELNEKLLQFFINYRNECPTLNEEQCAIALIGLMNAVSNQLPNELISVVPFDFKRLIEFCEKIIEQSNQNKPK